MELLPDLQQRTFLRHYNLQFLFFAGFVNGSRAPCSVCVNLTFRLYFGEHSYQIIAIKTKFTARDFLKTISLQSES